MADSGLPTYEQSVSGPPKSLPSEKHAGSIGEKALKIWHAPSANSLITASDETTPVYCVVDSRAPGEEEQRARSLDAQHKYESYVAQLRREGKPLPTQIQNMEIMRGQHGLNSFPAQGMTFQEQLRQERAAPFATGAFAQPSEFWTQEVHREADRTSAPIASIRRHVSTRSDVSITLHGQQTGIRQHAGLPHRKYEFEWQGELYTWKRTRSAPHTSRLDSGNYVCKAKDSTILAYLTSEDDRCDGTLYIEESTLERDILDLIVVTGYVMRDLDDERRNPGYLRYGSSAYGYGYGPYAGPYAGGLGFVPIFPAFPFFLF
ncbi:hypothetical protein PYCC9005_004835 [Savitreella phatthalungensis]